MVAEINSRLAGAGVLMLPQELEFLAPPPPAPGPDGEEPPPRTTAQQFSDLLQEAMIAPISDRSDPSSVVPIVVTAPGEQIGNAKLLTFWSESNDKDPDRLDRAIRRLALGMDVPAEIMLGLADSNHWTGWLVDESAIKLHVEPLLGLICDALTEGFLRPAVDDDPSLVIWYDTSALRQRPNRGPEAIELFDRHEISGETLRREHGFGDAFVALYIGAHGISQALAALVDAAAILADDAEIVVVFVGEGADKKAIQARAADLGLSNVRFLPGQPKARMPEWYATADAVFVPLRNIPMFESFIPSKMFEVLAAERPIVGSVKGEAREILERSGGAIVVDPEDAAAIAGAVRRLKADRALGAAFGARGGAFVRAHYDRRMLARRYLDLLARLVRRS
jgi:glycosyltransferase involved in cell wall biosynthesis